MLIPGEALERWWLTILQRYAHETQALGRSVRLPDFSAPGVSELRSVYSASCPESRVACPSLTACLYCVAQSTQLR